MNCDEEFEHTVDTVMTVGDLRQALDGISDDMPLRFVTAEQPGSRLAGPEQIAFAADLDDTCWNAETRSYYQGFVVSLEFPPGCYYRPKEG